MENVTFLEVDEGLKGISTHAIITREDGSQISMRKSTYDEMIAAQESHESL
jgi:hypothetical protein